jgi:hypothetical protein
MAPVSVSGAEVAGSSFCWLIPRSLEQTVSNIADKTLQIRFTLMVSPYARAARAKSHMTVC